MNNTQYAIADQGLIAMFLKMTPEERMQANDNAIRAIIELRNALQRQNDADSRPERPA